MRPCRLQVAALAAGAGVEIDVEKPYAELWYVRNSFYSARILSLLTIGRDRCPWQRSRFLLSNDTECHSGWGHIQVVQQLSLALTE